MKLYFVAVLVCTRLGTLLVSGTEAIICRQGSGYAAAYKACEPDEKSCRVFIDDRSPKSFSCDTEDKPNGCEDYLQPVSDSLPNPTRPVKVCHCNTDNCDPLPIPTNPKPPQVPNRQCKEGVGENAPVKTCKFPNDKSCHVRLRARWNDTGRSVHKEEYFCSDEYKDNCDRWSVFENSGSLDCFCWSSNCDPYDKWDKYLPPGAPSFRCKVGHTWDGVGSAPMTECGRMDVNACIVIIEDYSNGATRWQKVSTLANIIKLFLCHNAVKEGCGNVDLSTLINTSHIPNFVHPKRKVCACKKPGCDPDPGNSGYRVIPAWPLTTFLLAVAISVALRYA